MMSESIILEKEKNTLNSAFPRALITEISFEGNKTKPSLSDIIAVSFATTQDTTIFLRKYPLTELDYKRIGATLTFTGKQIATIDQLVWSASPLHFGNQDNIKDNLAFSSFRKASGSVVDSDSDSGSQAPSVAMTAASSSGRSSDISLEKEAEWLKAAFKKTTNYLEAVSFHPSSKSNPAIYIIFKQHNNAIDEANNFAEELNSRYPHIMQRKEPKTVGLVKGTKKPLLTFRSDELQKFANLMNAIYPRPADQAYPNPEQYIILATKEAEAAKASKLAKERAAAMETIAAQAAAAQAAQRAQEEAARERAKLSDSVSTVSQVMAVSGAGMFKDLSSQANPQPNPNHKTPLVLRNVNLEENTSAKKGGCCSVM